MTDAEPDSSPLFMQLLVFTDCSEIRPLLLPLQHVAVDVVLYKDLNDPQGIALLAMTEDPELLVTDLRDLLDSRVFRVLMQQHELTMVGRAAARNGRDGAPVEQTVKNPAWPWAVWYPMRTTEAFADLGDDAEQALFDGIAAAAGLNGEQLGELRLRSHALDRRGNELVHGVHAASLLDLSRYVEAARRAPRFAEHIAASGPFFVGRALRTGDKFSGPTARW